MPLASVRPIKSVPPPVEKGTTNFTGRSGKAAITASCPPAPQTMTMLSLVNKTAYRFIASPEHSKGCAFLSSLSIGLPQCFDSRSVPSSGIA
jgi:hypothetical protein